MTTTTLHRLLVALAVLLLVAAGVLYVLSVTLAPQGGPDVAARFVGYAWFAVVGAVLTGVVDFFVRAGLSRTGTRRGR
ncbi:MULTISPECIES: hypothetical protein [Frigoribacterium]|uniref:hypothetical protein n=1 Tax=Frigoribacterium TaxID=96492 RepID=UPI001565EEAF|nr:MULTISPECIES: hypothetical protein [Frigoribacterium]NQW88599.1 hypothetical protein [Frigoribacterium sp. VKM Ac-2860]NQX08592.1 hypothetical protein [Frigoribacterium sp. VKM Ac-2859]